MLHTAQTHGARGGYPRAVPRRSLDDRAAADLFFADLTGEPLRPSPFDWRRRGAWKSRGGVFVPGESAEAEAWSEADPARSAVINPGWLSWAVMISSTPSTPNPPKWAGAIRQRSDPSTDYTGWEDRSVMLSPIDKLQVGTTFDIRTTARVKGRLKNKDDAVYITDATVIAFPTRDYSPTNARIGDVNVEVGYQDAQRKLHFVKASWDYSKGCARLDIPFRITYTGKRLAPEDYTITWFGNDDPPITPFTPTP